MHKIILLAGAALLTAACNQGATDDTKTTQPEAPAKPKARHYCFYKKDASKDWAANRDAKGDVMVTGKALVDDVRYAADLGQPEVAGTTAKLWLSTTTNNSYARPDNWWDVSFTIPDSAAVTKVTVNCDAERVFADLNVAPGK